MHAVHNSDPMYYILFILCCHQPPQADAVLLSGVGSLRADWTISSMGGNIQPSANSAIAPQQKDSLVKGQANPPHTHDGLYRFLYSRPAGQPSIWLAMMLPPSVPPTITRPQSPGQQQTCPRAHTHTHTKQQQQGMDSSSSSCECCRGQQ